MLAGLWRFTGGAPADGPGAARCRLAPQASAASVIAAFFAFGGWWDLGRMSEEVDVARRRRCRSRSSEACCSLRRSTCVRDACDSSWRRPDRLARRPTKRYVAAAGSGAVRRSRRAGFCLRWWSSAVSREPCRGAARRDRGRTPRWRAIICCRPETSRLVRSEDRGRSPVGTVVQASIACVLVVLGSFDQILGYFVPAAVFFLGLSAATLWRLPRERDADDVFRAPFYPAPVDRVPGLDRPHAAAVCRRPTVPDAARHHGCVRRAARLPIRRLTGTTVRRSGRSTTL